MHIHLWKKRGYSLILLIKALGILYSGLCPYWVFARATPGIIETVTAPEAEYLAAFDSYESYAPQAMALGPDNRIYLADRTIIYRLESNGSATLIAGKPQALGEEIHNMLQDSVIAQEAHIVPGAMAFDQEGQLYFVDYINGLGARIARLEESGIITTFAGTGAFGYGGDGGDARKATFAFRVRSTRWSSLVFDIEGNLVILDYGNGRIRKIDSQRKITTLLDSTARDENDTSIGETGLLVGELALNPKGDLYFCTATRVYLRHQDGTIKRIAGTGERGFSGDGESALNASIDVPSSLAVDKMERLYIGDLNNNRIRRVNLSGKIETIAGNGSKYTDLAPCTAAEKPLAILESPCLSALGNGGDAKEATLWWPERLLFNSEGDLLVSMKSPFNFINWIGDRFSQLRRICDVERLTPTAITPFPPSSNILLEPNTVSSLQVYPNPFNSETVIRFKLQKQSKVDIQIINLAGQQVSKILVGENLPLGEHTFNFKTDALDLSSGLYIINAKTDENSLSKKVLLIR